MTHAPLNLVLLVLVLVAIAVDLLVGDPRQLPHPVVGIGKLIAWLERRLNKGAPRARRIKGLILTVCVVTMTFLLTWGAIAVLARIHPWLGVIAEVWLLSTALAIKGLRDAARAVVVPLVQGNLVDARRSVSMIVGRDTHDMDEAEVTRATVETVAENTVDGITAPLFWALMGGAPLALAYKAVNTLDSMVGYRNQRYGDLGYVSAKLDDLANWVPARLTALCMWLGGWLMSRFIPPGSGWRQAWAGTLRDAPKHPSPNAGWPEAMMAWLLGVQLGGINRYAGEVSSRATMGVAGGPLRATHISASINYMHAAWMVFLLLMASLALARGWA